MQTMILTILSGVVLLPGVILLIWAAIGSRGVYDAYIEPLDEDECRVKKGLPIGLFLNDQIALSQRLPKRLVAIAARYNNRIYSQIMALHDKRYADYFLNIHYGSRWIMGVLGYLLPPFFALILSLQHDSNALPCLVATPFAAVGLPLLMDQDLKNQMETRKTQIALEFPEFVNKLLLLVNAGMTVPKAWEKIVADNTKKSPLYTELELCRAEIQNGTTEAIAYEAFARRCGMKEIMKFVSVIILNLRKGGSEIVPTLRAQVEECWELRKATARRLGEQASSKLLMPMAMMLLGIIIIVALPAVLSLTALG